MKIDTFQTMAAIARKHFDNNLAAGQVLVASISPEDAKELRADLEACAGATIFEQGQGFVNLEAKWPGAGVAMELSGIGIRVVQGKVSPEFEPHVLDSRYIPVWAKSLTFDAAAQEIAAGKARADAEIATWSTPNKPAAALLKAHAATDGMVEMRVVMADLTPVCARVEGVGGFTDPETGMWLSTITEGNGKTLIGDGTGKMYYLSDVSNALRARRNAA